MEASSPMFCRRVEIPLSSFPYSAYVGSGLLEHAGELCKKAGLSGRCAVIADSNVFPLHGQTLIKSLEAAAFSPQEILFPSGEASKNLSETSRLLEELARLKLDRQSFIVALGGGVAGDLVGFVAAVFLRGVPFVQVPTTVVAQVDSSVGGKTGVNLTAGKNLAGIFHQPHVVIADTATLDTLPDREFNEGIAEIIKHAAIADEALLAQIERFHRGQQIEEIIARNIEIKASIVAADERETKGLRALLNFGHTLGHAIEKAAGYGRYLHGEAVALGMIAALRLSVLKAGLSECEAQRIAAAIRRFDLPNRLSTALDPELVVGAAQNDKKFLSGRIRFVLTKAIGSAFLSEEVTREDLLTAVKQLQK